MKRLWRWIERRLELARGAREAANRLGADDERAWPILDLAAEVELEARRWALLSGCDTHIRLPDD